MKNYILDGRYKDLLQYHGIDVEAVLKKAQIPTDALNHRTPAMSEESYYRFMKAIGELSDDDALPIKLSCTNKIEAFSPPIFAAYCSKNGASCIERLARYKRLIGPMQFILTKDSDTLTVEIDGDDAELVQPAFLVSCELAFLTHIIRRATKENVSPVSVEMAELPKGDALSEFLKCPICKSDRNAVRYKLNDLLLPFISYDECMWSYFEPELTKRLAELDNDESTSARVRSVLSELLSGGQCGIEDAAQRLGLSRRTLQRKLSEENTTFQKQLNSTRETLAIHYLRNTEMTTNDIAFLLGYQEINSFLRAFAVWTGKTVSDYRRDLQK